MFIRHGLQQANGLVLSPIADQSNGSLSRIYPYFLAPTQGVLTILTYRNIGAINS